MKPSMIPAVTIVILCGLYIYSTPTKDTSPHTKISSIPADKASDCGDVTIADMNWNSASLVANIDQFILQHGYGCNATLVPGDTMPTGTSMIEKGQPDIAPEFWSNSLKMALDKGVEEGRLRFTGKMLSDGGEEGFWVPKYMVDKDPSLATIDGIIANASLFSHPEDPNKAGFYTCPAGWNCQITAGNLFKALGLKEKGFEIIDPGSGAGLSGSIAKAYEQGEAWFGYYWAPTAILGKYDMVKVDLGAKTDAEHFKGCITQSDCLNPKATMYPPSAVDTIITESFAKRAPEAVNYLSNRSFTNAELNNLLAWMEENQADGEIASQYFLEQHPDIWHNWVSSDVIAKIKAAL